MGFETFKQKKQKHLIVAVSLCSILSISYLLYSHHQRNLRSQHEALQAKSEANAALSEVAQDIQKAHPLYTLRDQDLKTLEAQGLLSEKMKLTLKAFLKN